MHLIDIPQTVSQQTSLLDLLQAEAVFTCVCERERDVVCNGCNRKSCWTLWPQKEACGNHLAVNLPGPHGQASARKVSLTTYNVQYTKFLWTMNSIFLSKKIKKNVTACRKYLLLHFEVHSQCVVRTIVWIQTNCVTKSSSSLSTS